MSLYNLQFQPPYESTNAVDLPSGHQTQWENPRGLAMEKGNSRTKWGIFRCHVSLEGNPQF